MSSPHDRLQWIGTRNETNTQIKWQHTDMLGRLDAAVAADPLGLVLDMETQTKYDALDRTVAVIRDYTRPGKVASAITYDGLGRKSGMNDPDMGSWQYFYDPAGNLTEQRDALYLAGGHPDHDIFFTYDGMNRVIGKFYGAMHPTSGVPDVKYYYDNAMNDANGTNGAHSWGRLRAAEVSVQWQPTDANAHNYAYDTRGMLMSDVLTTTTAYSSRAYSLNYSYDAGGRPHTLTYPNPEGEQVTMGYNGQGAGLPNRLTSSLGLPNPVDSAAYNERGQLTSLAQGAIPQQNMLTTDFTYDETTTKRGWLTEVRASAAGSTLLDLHQHHTLNGNIDSVSQDAPNAGPNNPAFTNTFNYDVFDRLRTATSSSPNIDSGSLFPSQTDTFDTLGRLTSRTLNGTAYNYAYNATGHVDAPSAYDLGPDNYRYDANGSQVERSGGSLPQTRSFDAENRLVSVVQTPRDLSPATTSSFVYDANGMRLIQSVTVGGGNPTRTLYVGNVYEETLTGGANPPYIVYYSLGGKAVGLRRANQSAGNGQYRLVGDHLGSTTLLVDTNNPPAVTQRQYYKPYGEITWAQAPTRLTDMGFTGQRLDSGSGLLYYGARYYDAALSYFISPDSIAPNKGNPQSGDRYGYVQNNPLRYTDPTGMCADDPSNADDAATRNYTCSNAEATLNSFGIRVASMADWVLSDLWLIIEAVHDLMRAAHWDVAHFRAALGLTGDRMLTLRNADIQHYGRTFWQEPTGATGMTGWEENPSGRAGWAITLDVAYIRGLRHGQRVDILMVTMVHELAHVWDFNQQYAGGGCFSCAGALSYSLAEAAVKAGPVAAGQPSDYGFIPRSDSSRIAQMEYWAESVAAYVYPQANAGQNNYQSYVQAGKWSEDKIAYQYVRDEFQAFSH